MSQPQYFLKRGEKVFGPHSLDQIKKLDEQGKLKPSDLVSKSKDGSWHKFGDVADKLFPSKASSEPTPQGYFIRRGSKIIGPYPATQIKKLDENGKLANSDDVSKSMVGPWDKYGMIRENLLIEAMPSKPLARESIKKRALNHFAASIPNSNGEDVIEFYNNNEAYEVDEVYEVTEDDVSEPNEALDGNFADLPDPMPQASVTPVFGQYQGTVQFGQAQPMASLQVAANPNLIHCRDCNSIISKRATNCPQCGAPISENLGTASMMGRKAKTYKEAIRLHKISMVIFWLVTLFGSSVHAVLAMISEKERITYFIEKGQYDTARNINPGAEGVLVFFGTMLFGTIVYFVANTILKSKIKRKVEAGILVDDRE